MAVEEQHKGLHNLRPSKGATKARKRVGRGPSSGTGKTSGRGQKGQKSRSGSHMMRAGFEGGQMPLYMRVGKLRGSTKKMSMPMGPFRTRTQPVNIGQLAGFEKGTEVTPELLVSAGILKNLRHPVKILGGGDLTVALTVTAAGFSGTAKEKIEAAGGSVTLLPGRPLNAKAKLAAEGGLTKAQKRRLANEGPAATAAPTPAAAEAPAEDAPAE